MGKYGSAQEIVKLGGWPEGTMGRSSGFASNFSVGIPNIINLGEPAVGNDKVVDRS